jgi:hypothetical protein
MLLSEWSSVAPSSGCMNQAVLDALGPVLSDMGAGEDPECWVAWGEDPNYKYSVLAPAAAGLVVVAVRLNPGSDAGPRATAKLVRWPKIQIGEFSIEAAEGRRVVAVQVEGLVLKGTDEAASSICEFVRGLIAGSDGRAVPGPQLVQAAPAAARATKSGARGKGAARAGAAPATRGTRKGARAARQQAEAEVEPEPQFVPPHAIPVADEPPSAGPPPAAEKPAPPQPAPGSGPGGQPGIPPAPPAQPRPSTRESGSVWEIPPNPAARDKKPRTWRP